MAFLLTIGAAIFALGAFLAADVAREERRANRARRTDDEEYLDRVEASVNRLHNVYLEKTHDAE